MWICGQNVKAVQSITSRDTLTEIVDISANPMRKAVEIPNKSHN